MSREWKLYFDDMVSFCEKVMCYTHGLTREQFEASGLNYDATLWNVQLFGEAANHISENIRYRNLKHHLEHPYFRHLSRFTVNLFSENGRVDKRSASTILRRFGGCASLIHPTI